MIFRAEHCRLYMPHFYLIFFCLEIDGIQASQELMEDVCVCVY